MLSILMNPARLYAFTVLPYWNKAEELLKNKNGIHTVRGQEFCKIVLQDVDQDEQSAFIQEAKTNIKTLREKGLDELIELVREVEKAKLYPEEFKTKLDGTLYNYSNTLVNTKDFLDLVVIAGIRNIRELDHAGGLDLIYDIGRNETDTDVSRRNHNQKQFLQDPSLFQAAINGFIQLDPDVQTELFEFIKVLRYVKEHASRLGKQISSEVAENKPVIIPYTQD